MKKNLLLLSFIGVFGAIQAQAETVTLGIHTKGNWKHHIPFVGKQYLTDDVAQNTGDVVSDYYKNYINEHWRPTLIKSYDLNSKLIAEQQNMRNVATGGLATLAALYGLEALYHWYKGPKHNLKRDLNAAMKALNKADARVAIQEDKTKNITVKNHIIAPDFKAVIKRTKYFVQSIIDQLNAAK